MYNIFPALMCFLFVFSTVALLKLGFDFTRALLSDPPKQFEISNVEAIIYGVFVSYMITYLIFI